MMRSLLLLFSVAAACVSFGYASLVVREVEERLSSEQLRAELGFSSGTYVYVSFSCSLNCCAVARPIVPVLKHLI